MAGDNIFIDSAIGSPLWSSNVEDEQDVEVYELKEKDSGQATRTNSNGSEKQDERKVSYISQQEKGINHDGMTNVSLWQRFDPGLLSEVSCH